MLAFGSARCVDEHDKRQPIAPSECYFGIWVVNDDGTGLRRIRVGGGDPAWSPEGLRIAYTGVDHIYVMNADGSAPRPVTIEPVPKDVDRQEESPDFSPDGTRIVFTRADWKGPNEGRNFMDEDSDVFVVSALGGIAKRVSPGRGKEWDPTFSPDGRTIAFVRRVWEPDSGGAHLSAESGVYAFDLATGKERPLTVGQGLIGSAEGLSYSPDGRRVALSLLTGLYVMDADGSNLRRVMRRFGRDPTWSSVEPTLFFSGPPTESAAEQQITLQRLDLSGPGSRPQQIGGGIAGTDADWHPLGGEVPLKPVRDIVPPVPLLPGDVSSRTRFPDTTPFGFLVVDRTGVARIAASIARRSRGRRHRCRFAGRSSLGRSRSCSRRRYVRVTNARAWARRTAKLPRGTYEVAFKTKDVLGNKTRRPRVRVLRVRH